jgi:hypothetical protein
MKFLFLYSIPEIRSCNDSNALYGIFIDTCSPVIFSENINKNRSVPV